ncbi:hypothetical protein FB451DRAFT_1191476 [Mycena latifolia]|nr:hypothetical protein FB451DRAFT_1191476 [Mycena latifolia]
MCITAGRVKCRDVPPMFGQEPRAALLRVLKTATSLCLWHAQARAKNTEGGDSAAPVGCACCASYLGCRRPARAAGSAGSRGACRTRRSGGAGRSDGRIGGGDTKGDRAAEDDGRNRRVGRAREKKDGEREERKGGAETYPYPARKRRIRTCCDGKGRSDRIAVGAFPPVRLRMMLVDGLNDLRGNQRRQRKGTGHARYSLSGSAARGPSRTCDEMRIRICAERVRLGKSLTWARGMPLRDVEVTLGWGPIGSPSGGQVRFGSGSGASSPNAEPERRVRFRRTLDAEPEHIPKVHRTGSIKPPRLTRDVFDWKCKVRFGVRRSNATQAARTLNQTFGSSSEKARTLNLNAASRSVRFRFEPIFEPDPPSTNRDAHIGHIETGERKTGIVARASRHRAGPVEHGSNGFKVRLEDEWKRGLGVGVGLDWDWDWDGKHRTVGFEAGASGEDGSGSERD